MSRDQDLFGTDQPPVERREFTAGRLSFALENGALRHVTLDGIEAIRAIAFLVRDRDWGTVNPTILDEVITQSDDAVRIAFLARYENGGARLDVDVTVQTSADGVTVSAKGRSFGEFETNRAGFTVLHPINGVAGQPVRVDHSDGSSEASVFPYMIDPWQPFMDITGLTHHVGDSAVTCAFHGDTFEMEDQRQWGDASYKTYNRPLALPWPYLIGDGAALEQSVSLTWAAAERADVRSAETENFDATVAQLALVISPQDALRLASSPTDLLAVNPQRLLCHLDATLGDTAGQFDAFARAQRACPETTFDLELICRCDADPEPEILELSAQMAAAGFAPASVLVCPSVDRQSTPPGSQWPACPPLEQVHAAAARAFPDLIRGGGSVSFFPELNRKRPPVEMLDFVNHGLCPIVHAADDLSVMETLETISHITRSARAIIGTRSYRIGPASIAMRQNPYGDRTLPNPDNGRVCMADDDPRHRAKFGAAYAVGLATALAPSGIDVWTPAGLYGPRGVVGDAGETWPLTAALKQLAALAGQPVKQATQSGGIARLVAGNVEFVVNVTDQQINDLGPYEWRLTDLSA
ncbi:hypothetical protein [Celeribacter sp.]|uniref:hypothetical protein n=1 Tax=Celeribacter sp. TaxID=1890673 RepID=UPI003A931819